MPRSWPRWAWPAAALAASAAVTAALWWAGFPGFFLFLAFPFLFLGRRRATAPGDPEPVGAVRCPACGTPAAPDAGFCHRDGTRLRP